MIPVLLILPMPVMTSRSAYIRGCVKECLIAGELPLAGDIYEWIGAAVPRNITSDLMQFCKKVVVYNDFPLTQDIIEIIERAEAKGMPVEKRRLVKLTDILDILEVILNEVSMKLSVSLEDMKSDTRKRDVVDARFVYFRRAKEKTLATLWKIGDLVGRIMPQFFME